jgi:hypothetical protein
MRRAGVSVRVRSAWGQMDNTKDDDYTQQHVAAERSRDVVARIVSTRHGCIRTRARTTTGIVARVDEVAAAGACSIGTFTALPTQLIPRWMTSARRGVRRTNEKVRPDADNRGIEA